MTGDEIIAAINAGTAQLSRVDVLDYDALDIIKTKKVPGDHKVKKIHRKSDGLISIDYDDVPETLDRRLIMPGISDGEAANEEIINGDPQGDGGDGVSDHGDLTGLDDNDHGAVYYTETEMGNESVTVVVTDHGTAATDQVVNVCYGTGAAPTANTTTIGSLYIQYTA